MERRHGVARLCLRRVDGSREVGDRHSDGRGIDIGILRRGEAVEKCQSMANLGREGQVIRAV